MVIKISKEIDLSRRRRRREKWRSEEILARSSKEKW